MTVQKVIPKDPQKENEKYLIFLDYTLNKLRSGRPSGISLRNLASDYKTEMGTTLSYDELKEFMRLYDGIHFDKAKESIDRIIIKNRAVRILLKYGSIREYLKQTASKNFAKKLVDFSFNGVWLWLDRIAILIALSTPLIALQQCLSNNSKKTQKEPQETSVNHIDSKISSTDTINILKNDTLTKKLK